MENSQSALLLKCREYEVTEVSIAVDRIFAHFEFDWTDKSVLLKPNLVAAMAPEKAATTHPMLIAAVARKLYALGAKTVIIGDSHGGIYSSGTLNHIYSVTKMKVAAAESGAQLNNDFTHQICDIPDGVNLKKVEIINAFITADVVINMAKLKTHALTGFSGAVKNFYGLVPGLVKVQLHAANSSTVNFSDLLIDLQEFAKNKTVLHIIDGIIGMEGDGPTAGNPRRIGVIIASTSPYFADILALNVVGIEPKDIPYLVGAKERGLIANFKINIMGDKLDECKINDFKNVVIKESLFDLKIFPKFIAKCLVKLISRKPYILKNKCKACEKCAEHCPVNAIKINKVASIDYDKCIKCFCCQELCPFHIIIIKKTLLYKILQR